MACPLLGSYRDTQARNRLVKRSCCFRARALASDFGLLCSFVDARCHAAGVQFDSVGRSSRKGHILGEDHRLGPVIIGAAVCLPGAAAREIQGQFEW